MELMNISGLTYMVKFDSEEEKEMFDLFKQRPKMLKAADVMSILNISRQTLSRYVKIGRLKVITTDTGKYLYDYDSVMDVLKYSKQSFTGSDIEYLYKKCPHCNYIDSNGNTCTESNPDKLFINLIVPESKGGHKTLDNAQLRCEDHLYK